MILWCGWEKAAWSSQKVRIQQNWMERTYWRYFCAEINWNAIWLSKNQILTSSTDTGSPTPPKLCHMFRCLCSAQTVYVDLRWYAAWKSASARLCLLFLRANAHVSPSSPPLLWLQRLLALIDKLLSGKPFKDNRKVSTILDLVENTLRLIGPFITPPGTKRSTTHTGSIQTDTKWSTWVCLAFSALVSHSQRHVQAFIRSSSFMD